LSGAKDAVGRTAVIADGGYRLLAAPTGAGDGLRLLLLPLPLPRRSPIGRDLGARRPRRRRCPSAAEGIARTDRARASLCRATGTIHRLFLQRWPVAVS
jgi:hypothetical protein